MCTLSNLRLQVSVFSWVKFGLALYVFSLGIYFAVSSDIQKAFGTEFVAYGLSLIFLALLSAVVIVPHLFAVRRHNRFLLVVAFVMDTIVCAELINYGTIVSKYIPSEFNKALQLDCLSNTPTTYTIEECTPFYNSDRTAGMRLVWERYFTDKANKYSNQVLATFETGCCGFFQPFHCIENNSSFPANRLTTGVDSSLLKQRVTCGAYPNYYIQQSNCADDAIIAQPPVIGGCMYDLAVSSCLDATIYSYTIGCASAVEDYAVALISPHATMLIVTAVISMLFMLYSCCLWWKRKESDIFPEFVAETKVV